MTGLVLTLKGELGVDCCDGRAHCGHTDRHDATSDRAGGVWAGVGLDCTAVYSSLVYTVQPASQGQVSGRTVGCTREAAGKTV